MIFHILTCIFDHLRVYHAKSRREQLPVGLIAQLVENCSVGFFVFELLKFSVYNCDEQKCLLTVSKFIRSVGIALEICAHVNLHIFS